MFAEFIKTLRPNDTYKPKPRYRIIDKEGNYLTLTSGKTIWNNIGAAKSALKYEIERNLYSFEKASHWRDGINCSFSGMSFFTTGSMSEIKDLIFGELLKSAEIQFVKVIDK